MGRSPTAGRKNCKRQNRLRSSAPACFKCSRRTTNIATERTAAAASIWFSIMRATIASAAAASRELAADKAWDNTHSGLAATS